MLPIDYDPRLEGWRLSPTPSGDYGHIDFQIRYRNSMIDCVRPASVPVRVPDEGQDHYQPDPIVVNVDNHWYGKFWWTIRQDSVGLYVTAEAHPPTGGYGGPIKPEIVKVSQNYLLAGGAGVGGLL